MIRCSGTRLHHSYQFILGSRRHVNVNATHRFLTPLCPTPLCVGDMAIADCLPSSNVFQKGSATSRLGQPHMVPPQIALLNTFP